MNNFPSNPVSSIVEAPFVLFSSGLIYGRDVYEFKSRGEVRSLRLDVFYPHLNLIPETSHLAFPYTRNISQFFREKNIGNQIGKRSPRISLHLFKTLFRFSVPRFPLERSRKGKEKRNQSPSRGVRSCVVDHAVGTWSIRAVAFVHRYFHRVDWPRFIRA